MRVLLTTDAVGGVWTHSLALTEALRPHGVDVVLASMGPLPTGRQRDDARRCGASELHVSDFALEWMHDPWRDVDAAGEWLMGLADRTGADIVHVNGFSHAALPWRMPVVAGAHSCVASWWRAVHSCEAPPEWGEYRRRVRNGLDVARLVIFPSRSLLLAMEAEHGPIARARIIHNGLCGFRPQPERKEPIVLAAGRFWDAGKNLAVLEDVASRIRWKLFVAGDWRNSGSRTRPQGVVALGRLGRTELAEWQSKAAIAVHPARYEPFGYAPLEAARARCALVLADIPSLRELWDGAALFVPPDDPSAIATAVSRLAAEPATLAVMRARAARRARSYTGEAMASAYANVYRELAAAAAGGVACAS